ncbi:MAG TPA: amino acid ABC transporter permease [Candidatus Baltobacteraceae bacterium]|nr:amino acid ABC transporter permease [Candidatus Baltobacteraceae bacterium]
MHGYTFQFRDVLLELPTLLDGALTTLHISVLTLLISFVVGTLGALCRMSRLPWLRVPATWYVELIRNTPLLVQLFFIYFGFSQIDIQVSSYTAGLIGLVVNNAAYLTEIIRAGIQAIHKGQFEAGYSLGLSFPQLMRYVVFPQAFRVIYPPMSNQFIGIILWSSLVSTISVQDLALRGKELASTTFRSFETYAVVTVIYVVMTFAISATLKVIGYRVFRRPA